MRIKSIAFTTDVAIIKNINADAVIAVYPFTPQPTISQAIIGISDVPVFVGVGGGITGGDRSVRLAIEAENQGAFGVVVNAPISDEVISRIKEVADIPVIATIVSDRMDIRSRIEAGADFLNVSGAAATPQIVRRIRAQFPDVPILATGGPNDETILETIRAGANAITYSPPSNGELFADIMQKYRGKLYQEQKSCRRKSAAFAVLCEELSGFTLPGIEIAACRERGRCPVRDGGRELAHLLFASVAGCKDARQACFCILTRQIVSVFGCNGIFKRRALRRLTDRNKKTFYIDSFCFSGFAVEKLRAPQAVIRQQKLLNGAALQNPNVFLRLCAANQLGACPESVSAVDQCDAAAGVCQKQRVLQRRIAAAHDSYTRAFIKCAVADCAIGYAAAGKRVLLRKTELTVRCAGCKDHSPCFQCAVRAGNKKAVLRLGKPGCLRRKELCAERFCLLGHLLGKLCPGN